MNRNIQVAGGKENKNDSASSGERKRKSPNQDASVLGYGLREARLKLVERTWKDLTERVKSPYTKVRGSEQDPE